MLGYLDRIFDCASLTNASRHVDQIWEIFSQSREIRIT